MTAKITMALAAVLTMISCAQAQSVQIPVRCTVPSLSGVNTPLIEASSQETTTGEGYLSAAQEESGSRVVKTYYAR